MYCVKCGCKLDDDAVFCTECGTRVAELKETIQESELVVKKDTTTHVESSTSTEKIEKLDTTSSTSTKTLSGKDKKFITIGLVGLIAVAIIAVILNRKPSINLNDYITVEASGYNTFGKANIVFDSESFLNDFEAISSAKEEPEPEYEDGSFEEFMYGMSELMNEAQTDSIIGGDINWEVNKTENLSNGDVVELKWNCNDEHIKEKYGCILKYKDISYKVDNLDEIKLIDPFEGIKVKLEQGTLANYFVVIKNNSNDIYSKLEYSIDNKPDVKIGDSINITVESDKDMFIREYGVSWNESTMSYTITEEDFKDAKADETEELDNESGNENKGELVTDREELLRDDGIRHELFTKATDICDQMKIKLPKNKGFAGPIGSYELVNIDFCNTDEGNGVVVVVGVDMEYVDNEEDPIDDWYIFYPVPMKDLRLTESNEISYIEIEVAPDTLKKDETYTDGSAVTIEYEGYARYKDYLAVRNKYFNKCFGKIKDDKVQSLFVEENILEWDEENNKVYDDEYICELARKYYAIHHGDTPPLAEIDSKKGNEVSIHLYEMMIYEDYPEENHAATWDWYTVDVKTLRGVDNMGELIDLNEAK